MTGKKNYKSVAFNIIVVSLLLMIIIGGHALAETTESSYATLLFSIPVGNGEGKIAYTEDVEDMERFGPESIAVNDEGNFFILDSVDSKVEIFDMTGKHIKSITLPENKYCDLAVSNEDHIVVLSWDGNIIKINEGILDCKGKIEKEERELIFTRLTNNFNNEIVLWDLLKKQEISLDTGYATDKFNSADIKRDNKKITILFEGEKFDINYTYTPAGTYPIQLTNIGEILVEEKEVLIGQGLYVETRVSKYKNGERVSNALALPTYDCPVKVPRQFICTSSNGDVFQMVPTEDSIDIYKLSFFKGNNTNINQELINRIIPKESFVFEEQDVSIRSNYDAYFRALDMVDHTWYYNPNTMLTPNTSTTRSPSHLASASAGMQEGIPYRWGGMNGLDTSRPGYTNHVYRNFGAGLGSSNTAGDTRTGYVVSSTSGVDCSGFICAAYEIYPKLSTATMGNEFYQTQWGNLWPGDIANKPGHVWMFVAWAWDAGVFTLESTMAGFEQKAKEWGRSWEDAQTYTPMKKN